MTARPEARPRRCLASGDSGRPTASSSAALVSLNRDKGLGTAFAISLRPMRTPEVARDSVGRPSPLTPPTVGLALSGGGVRGLAHIGVLEVLSQRVEIARLAGASAGAMVAAAWAAGRSTQEILEVARTFKPLRPWRTQLSGVGMLDPGYFRRVWYQLLPETFEDLQVPITVVVTSMQTGEPVLFSSGPLREVVFASCALPPLYGAVEIDGEYYMDGGLAMNLPVPALMGLCDVIIASEVNPRHHPVPNCEQSTLGLMNRALEMIFKAATMAHTQLADLVIEPPQLQSVFLLDASRVEDTVDMGRKEALRVLETEEAQRALGSALRPAPSPVAS